MPLTLVSNSSCLHNASMSSVVVALLFPISTLICNYLTLPQESFQIVSKDY